jgi:hypothetical protein
MNKYRVFYKNKTVVLAENETEAIEKARVLIGDDEVLGVEEDTIPEFETDAQYKKWCLENGEEYEEVDLTEEPLGVDE